MDTHPLTLEIGLAKTLGVSRATLKVVRTKLDPDTHWRQQGRNVAYTDAGVAEVRRILGVPLPDYDPSLKGHGATPDVPLANGGGPAGEEELEVVRSNFKNRKIIQAKRSNGELVLVRVRTADNFRTRLTTGAPMTLRAAPEGPIWWHRGRCPRAPGKW